MFYHGRLVFFIDYVARVLLIASQNVHVCELLEDIERLGDRHDQVSLKYIEVLLTLSLRHFSREFHEELLLYACDGVDEQLFCLALEIFQGKHRKIVWE